MPDLHTRLRSSLAMTYSIEQELGGGGMSRVFVATESALGRQVVVKVLPPEMSAGVSIERFKREIQLAARLQHPHIVPVLSAGEIDGLPYFTMPYVEGETLRARLARRGELPVSDAVRILREIASALDYAHEQGVVHRDIKPDNVLLSRGSAMVTDFGVAKALSSSSNGDNAGVTSLGIALGTPAYMAPEQASADPAVDHRADIYAFGVLAYELLTGQAPFAGRTPQGMLAAHVTEEPEPIQKRRASLPPTLSALVMRCLEKRPADRPQTAGEIVRALDDITTPSGGTAPTSAQLPPAAPPPRPSMLMVAVRESRAVVLAAATVLACVLLGAFYVYRLARERSVSALPRSIVVLPFVNAAADTTTQFFADGMTDELTSAVARIPDLSVASRSATDAAVRAVPGNMNAIGHRLSVGAALEGKIRRSVGRMRLTVTLTNINSGRILWNETYDREVKDAFAVQDEVARAVASALRVKLNGANQVLASHSTTNSEAHDLYLRGRFMQAKYTEVALNKSLELFQKALEKDSSYALAWAGIGDSWGALADDYVAPKIAYPKLREAALRGLAIDSTLPELKYTYGMGTWEIDHDFRGALRRVELAMRNDRVAGAVDGVYLYSVGLWELGLRDSAAVMMRQSVERDPANPGVLMSAFQYERHARDTVGARATCERLKELSAGARCAAELRLMEGSGDAGLSYFRGTVTDADPRTVMGARRGMVEALVKLGRVAEARAIVAQVDAEARRGPRYVREDALAIMWAAVGDNERALQWLRRGVQSNSAGLQVFYLYAHDYPIVRDPRAVAILKSVGVPDPPPYL